MPKNATRPSQDKHENGAYLFPEIDDPVFEEAMTSAIAKIMADSSDLSKAAPGEQLEYLTPGEKPPGETPVRTTRRGARGYYPSEVAGGEEEAAAPREAEPTEEREIEAVQAPEAKPIGGGPVKGHFNNPDSMQEVHDYQNSKLEGLTGGPATWPIKTPADAVLKGSHEMAGDIYREIGGWGDFDYIDDHLRKIANTLGPEGSAREREWKGSLSEDVIKLNNKVQLLVADAPAYTERQKTAKALMLAITERDVKTIRSFISHLQNPDPPSAGDWVEAMSDIIRGGEQRRQRHEMLQRVMGSDVRKSNDDSIHIGDLNIPIEVATDSASGLSGRDRLTPSTGMLFIFDKSPVITMKGMKFPLDIVWMADNRVVDLTENALVPALESAFLYTPKKHATTALEINGGEVQTLGIKIGDSVEDAGSTQSNLSKLLVLETALEYFIKAESGKREYLAPGEKAPEGYIEQPGSKPGVRFYVPGEVKPKEKGGWAGRVGGVLDRIRGRGAEPSELPEEEREIEVVAPPSVGEEEPTGWEKAVLSSDDAREQFEVMAKDLEDVLSSIRPEHKQFLGTPFDDSKLIADNLERVGFTDGTFEGTDRPSGSGIHSEFNWTVFIDGKPFIYKVVPGENRSEQLSYAVDRALGLNVVPYIKAHNMDPDKLHEAFQKSFKDEEFSDYLQVNLARRVDPEFQKSHGMPPAGHWMEFCETCPDSEESSQIIAEMYTTKEGREEFFKLMFLDFITGNDDRHSGNWLVTKDKKALAIDNGFGGGGQKYTPMAETAHRVVGRVDGGMKLGFPWQSQDALKAHLMDLDFDPNEIQEYVTRLRDPATLGAEAEDVFDKYYDLGKIYKALEPINWSAESFWANDYGAKEGFKKYAVEWMTRGMGGSFEGDTEDETRDDDDIMWDRFPIPNSERWSTNIDAGEYLERPSVRQNAPSGFLSRIRNWVKLPGRNSPSSHEFHPEFEGATPPSQRGGPQQGRRGRS